MNKKLRIKIIISLLVLISILIPSSFALYKKSNPGDATVAAATWSVELDQDNVDDDLTIIPGLSNATYTLNVQSLSDVDIKYDVVLSNLPTGVEASLNGVNFEQASNGTITFTNVGTILYNANDKTNTHTITLRGTGTTYVNEQVVSVNVIAKQIISS